MKKDRQNEPEVDESLLTPAQKAELKRHTFNWKWGVFWGVVGTLIIVCIIVISLL